MSGIKGKVIAITGASSGIGAASAHLLAERGARLVLGARRKEPLQSLVDEIVRSGAEAVCTAIDVSRRQGLSDLVALAFERYGRLDVLVGNAGVGPISPLDDLRVDDWDQMIDVNLKGFLNGVAAALPVFRRQGSGHFVTVISTAGLKIVPNQSVYAATKNAVRTVSEGLRLESGGNLRVTGISPGIVKTGFAASMTDPDIRAKVNAAMDDIGLEPAAIARAIAFAIEQPADVEVGDIVIRPTVQA